jgi:hypothetical protein
MSDKIFNLAFDTGGEYRTYCGSGRMALVTFERVADSDDEASALFVSPVRP